MFKHRKLGLLAGTALLVLAGTIATAPAEANSFGDGVAHFVQCAGWMFSDSQMHADNCSPGHAFPDRKDPEQAYFGDPPALPPPSSPPEEDDPSLPPPDVVTLVD